jgi:predicted phage-related endonuclease
MLIQKERDFWTHVEYGVPPTIDGSEASANLLNKQFPQGVPSSRIMLPDETLDVIRQYGEARDLAEHYAEQKRKFENSLKQILGQHEVGIIGDLGMVRWSNVKTERFDAKTLQAEQPDIYEKYLRETTHRRFTVKAA